MTTLDSNTIRVRVDVLSFDAPVDDVRKQLVQFWRCNDLRFRVGIFHGDEVIDVSNFAALHLSVRSLDDGNPPSGGTASLMLGLATTFDTTVTAETWATGAKQHAEITFSAADNALEAGEYWISFWATAGAGHTVTLGAGVCKILENGGISLTPPEPKENYYTAEECDEKFALIGSGDGGSVDLSDYYTKTETYSQDEVDDALSDYYTKTETYSQDEVDEALGDYYTKTETYSQSEVDDTLGDYYTKTETDSALGDYYTKTETYSQSEVDDALGDYYTKTETYSQDEVDEALGDYYTKTETYSQSEVDEALGDYYTKTETYSQSEVDDTLGDYYTKTETDSALGDYYTAEECDEKFALIGSGDGGSVDLSDYYTKTETYSQSEVDDALGDYYTKTEADSALGDYYTAEECDEKFALIGSGDGGSVDLSDYYTKTETYSQSEVDDALGDYYTKTEADSALGDYYTAEECDEKFALIGSGDGGSVDLSDYYTKTETYSQSEVDDTLGDYYTKTEADSALGDYYTKTETYSQSEVDDALGDYYTKTEADSALGDYYTAEECDEKFALIGSGDGGSGGGSGGSGDGGLFPENKGELVIGNGSGAALLTAGQNRQLLIANPNATLGAEWSNYPWQLLEEITIADPVSAVIFENAFNAESFWHYKLSYSFITTSVDGERLLMVFGYDDDGTTIWETSTDEYSYSTSDFSGSVAKYAAYQFVDGFFGFGSDSATYRNNGGWIHGEMDLWNSGDVNHRVQARACTSAYRIYNDSFIANGGIYNFVYKNAGAKVIRSLKIYVATGTLTSGKFTLYGIH